MNGSGPQDDDPADPPGLDLAAFLAYLAKDHPDEVTGPVRARVIAGGRSNLTYDLTDGTRSWIVRRPPLGHVLVTAHDMAREYRFMSALAPTDVPVPAMLLLCEDPDVLGAPFYVMEKVDGTPYRNAAELAPLGAGRTRAVVERSVDTLATLHAVDPAALPLGGLGRPDGFLDRQVRRWGEQLEASRSRELPGIDELLDRLRRRPVRPQPAAVVHGDYRLDNVLIGPDDRVTAVLDWEMATVGDPLTDVALMLVYQRLARLPGASAHTDAARAPGFPTDAQVVERYVAASGRDLSDLGFYLGLAHFKLAVILEGIHRRYRRGQTVGDGFETTGDLVAPLIEGGLSALQEG